MKKKTTTISDKLYAKYAQLYATEKKAAREREEITNQLKELFTKNHIGVQTTEYGKFTMYHNVKYKYTDAVKKLQEKEVKQGLAEATQVDSLRFTPFIDTK